MRVVALAPDRRGEPEDQAADGRGQVRRPGGEAVGQHQHHVKVSTGPHREVSGASTNPSSGSEAFHIRLTPSGWFRWSLKSRSRPWSTANGIQRRNQMMMPESPRPPPTELVVGDDQAVVQPEQDGRRPRPAADPHRRPPRQPAEQVHGVEDRHLQPCRLDHPAEGLRRVAAAVADGTVERAVQRGVAGHEQHHAAAGRAIDPRARRPPTSSSRCSRRLMATTESTGATVAASSGRSSARTSTSGRAPRRSRSARRQNGSLSVTTNRLRPVSCAAKSPSPAPTSTTEAPRYGSISSNR